MTDQEKVIKAIECCLKGYSSCHICPYFKDTFSECQRKLHDGVTALIKEHEPMKPTWIQGKAYCGNCGQRLPRKRADREINYCGCCGKPVKWDA